MQGDGKDVSVGILEAGPLAPALAERYGSHTAFFRAYLGPAAHDMLFPSYRVYQGELPASVAAHDAYLITGSRYSVYDPFDWIAPLKDFVRQAAVARPVVGICFGHQLVAEAFGGRVSKAEQGWGVGVHRYRLAHRAGFMHPALDEVALIASHQDQVVAAPPGALVLGGSDFCPVGALQIGDNVFSIQLHPEMQRDYGHDLYEMRRAMIGSEQIDAAQASLNQPNDADAVRDWILRFIRDRVERAGRR